MGSGQIFKRTRAVFVPGDAEYFRSLLTFDNRLFLPDAGLLTNVLQAGSGREGIRGVIRAHRHGCREKNIFPHFRLSP
jgi:hypothetical protein